MSERPLKKRILDWLAMHVGVPLAYLLFRVINLTGKRVVEDKGMFESIVQGKRYVYAFWHCDSFHVCSETGRFAPYGKLIIMASQSRDGALMVRFLEKLGTSFVRGSTSRGGMKALLKLIRAVKTENFGGLAVDAPRGPRLRLNTSGILLLSQRTGLPIVPVAANVDRKWVFSSWDRTELPKPFATTHLVYGEPFEVPADADADQIEILRQELESRLHTLKGEKPDNPKPA